jgi:hypothetical protein
VLSVLAFNQPEAGLCQNQHHWIRMSITRKVCIATLVLVVVDLLVYVDIANSGPLVKCLGPTAEELGPTSFPPSFFVWLWWITLHLPTSRLLPITPEKLEWLFVFNDVLIIGTVSLAFWGMRTFWFKMTHNRK